MKSMSVSEFKKHCTRVLREVAERGETLTITSRRKPVATVAPARRKGRHPAWGAMGGHLVSISDDFDEPLGDREWEAAD